MARPRQYGTYMPKVKKVTATTTKPKPPPYNPYAPWDPSSGRPPTPPGADVINRLYPEYNERTDPQWESLLNARVKPYETAVGKVRDMDESRAEFQFEQARDANERLSQGFASLLMGGKTGEEGTQYAKENFGGQYLPLQAMSIAHQHLTELTSDWNDRDWEIASEYQKAMAEVPGLKEQMRASITKDDTDEYTRNFNMANLYLEEMWNVYNANAKQYNTDQQLLAAKKMAAEEAGLIGWRDRKDALREAGQYTDDEGKIYKVRQAKDGSWVSYPTGASKPVKPGSKTNDDIKYRNSAISEAKYRTSAGPTIWEIFNDPKQGWVARDTGKKKSGSVKNKGLSDAQTAENEIANYLFDNREQYVGKRVANKSRRRGAPKFTQEGGMSYAEAYAQLFDYALQRLRPYGRSSDYVARWVRARLDSLYPGTLASGSKPRGG